MGSKRDSKRVSPVIQRREIVLGQLGPREGPREESVESRRGGGGSWGCTLPSGVAAKTDGRACSGPARACIAPLGLWNVARVDRRLMTAEGPGGRGESRGASRATSGIARVEAQLTALSSENGRLRKHSAFQRSWSREVHVL